MKNQISKKEENLELLKKNSNFLKIKEIDIETNSYEEEIQKLQDFFNDLLEKNQQKKEFPHFFF